MLTWFSSCSKCSVKSCQQRGEWVLGSLWFLFNISKAQLHCSLSTQSDCGELGAQEHNAVQKQRCEWCHKKGVEHELSSSSRTPPAVCAQAWVLNIIQAHRCALGRWQNSREVRYSGELGSEDRLSKGMGRPCCLPSFFDSLVMSL